MSPKPRQAKLKAEERVAAQLGVQKKPPPPQKKPKKTQLAKIDYGTISEPLGDPVTLSDIEDILENGTEEMKDLLKNECLLVYECRVCGNIYQDEDDFVKHKMEVCKARFKEEIAHLKETNENIVIIGIDNSIVDGLVCPKVKEDIAAKIISNSNTDNCL